MNLFNETVELVAGATRRLSRPMKALALYFAMKYDDRHTIKARSNGHKISRPKHELFHMKRNNPGQSRA